MFQAFSIENSVQQRHSIHHTAAADSSPVRDARQNTSKSEEEIMLATEQSEIAVNCKL